MNPYQVLKTPLMTEKSALSREKSLVYSFEIDYAATKLDVKDALKSLYNVDVTGVRTLIQRGKRKRRGNYLGRTISKTKRAFVTLKAGQTLSIFSED